MDRWIAALLAACLGLAAGCDTQSSADQLELASQGASFLLSEEPEGAVGILEHRGSLNPEDENAQPKEVVLWGRIGGKKHTWSEKTAEFVLSDPTFALATGENVCTDD